LLSQKQLGDFTLNRVWKNHPIGVIITRLRESTILMMMVWKHAYFFTTL